MTTFLVKADPGVESAESVKAAAEAPGSEVAVLATFRIVDNLGAVRGVVVRSRSVFGTIGAGFQTMLGGNISLFTELAERTRKQAFDTMLVQAYRAGATQ